MKTAKNADPTINHNHHHHPPETALEREKKSCSSSVVINWFNPNDQFFQKSFEE